MTTPFDLYFSRLVSPSNEGGYVNDPQDPGGETKYGISKRSYPHLDIANLTLDQAKEIYFRDFWLRGQMDKLHPELAFQLFDFAVNSGIETSVRMLQRSVGVAEDGHIGPYTLATLNKFSTAEQIMLLTAVRLDFWRKLSTWQRFGSGWAGRAAADLRYAVEDL